MLGRHLFRHACRFTTSQLKSLSKNFVCTQSISTLRRAFSSSAFSDNESIPPQELTRLIAKKLALKMRDANNKLDIYTTEITELNNLIDQYESNPNISNYREVLRQLEKLELFNDAIEMNKRFDNDDTISFGEENPAGFNPNSRNETTAKWRRFMTQNLFLFIVTITLLYYFFGSNKDDDNEGGKIFENLSGQKDNPQTSKTKFSDVQGISEFRQELEDIVDFLKNGKKYRAAGAYIPKGVLLSGPPGTGKTLLAKAIAGEAGCKFYYKSASEFEEVYVGVGADRVKKLFAEARRTAPSIIFIDEIDALATRRSSFSSGTSRQTINQLLTEMDGFKLSENVIVIGATNMPEKIDKAVLRPGRFDKLINIPYPDKEGRKEIFQLYLNKVKYDKDDVHLDTLVSATTGFSGASIKNMVNLAVLNAIKEKRSKANHLDFEFALDRITMGVGRKSMVVSDEDKLMTAYHEGGHTLVSLLTKSGTGLHKVTILPRGPALGFTAMLPEQEVPIMNREELLNTINIAMGGRVAEEMVYGNDDVTTGCSSDMDKATECAYKLLREYSMDPNFLISRSKEDLSETYNARVDKQAHKLLQDSLAFTRQLLKENRHLLDTLAHELVKRETMSKKEILSLLNLHK